MADTIQFPQTDVTQFASKFGGTEKQGEGVNYTFSATGPTFADLADEFGHLFSEESVTAHLPEPLQKGLAATHLGALQLQKLDGGGYRFGITLIWDKYQPDDSQLPFTFTVKTVSVSVTATKSSKGLALAATLAADQISLHDVDLEMSVSAALPSLLLKAELKSGQADKQKQLLGKLPLNGVPKTGKKSPTLQDLKIVAALREPSVLLHVAVADLIDFEHLEVREAQADIFYRGGEGVSGSVWTIVEIPYQGGAIDLMIKGAIKASGWSFFGGTVPGTEVKLGKLIEDVAGAFKADKGSYPSFLDELVLDSLTLSYDAEQADSDFTFGCVVEFPVTDTLVLLSILIDMQKSKSGAYTQTFRGTMRVAGNEFDLEFEREKGATAGAAPPAASTLLAAYKPPADAGLALNSLVAAFAPDVAKELPKVELEVKDILFAYAQRTAAGRTVSTWLFGLALALELDLTRIPIVGDELKQFKPLGISSIQALYASRPLPLSSAEEINAILDNLGVQPALPLPPSGPAAAATPTAGAMPAREPQALSEGFNFAATFDLPRGQYTLQSGARASMPQTPALLPPSSPGSGPGGAPSAGAPAAATGSGNNATWIDVQTQIGPLMLQKVGGRYANGRIWLLMSGALAAGPLQLSVQGMGVGFALKLPPDPGFTLDGLGLSYSSGPISITGVFLKTTGPVYDAAGKKTGQMLTQYAGEVRVQAEVFSLLAVGAYGQMAGGAPTVFVYGALSAADGAGIVLGPITITGLALGFGINRRVLVPSIDWVSQFPMVTMVMGPSGAPGPGDESTPAAKRDPGQVLASMVNELPPQQGQYFGAIGLRFSLFETIDCFALVIVQGGRSLEISLIGIGRFKEPTEGNAICYVELDLLIDIKPDSGIFKLEARLANSWVLDPACRITGGFALYIWYGGQHKGDFVISLGGYHPRFVKPSHYPTVPRLGLNWRVSNKLVIKGGTYFAITPSTFMAGGRLEAAFRDGRAGADFIAYADFLIQWKPLYYDIAMGISVRAFADLWLFTIHITLSVDLSIQGPPIHGVARLKVGGISVTVRFGDTPEKPPLIGTWSEFGASFLDRQKGGGAWTLPSGTQTAPGPNLLQLNLAKGEVAGPKKQTDDAVWRVRADEVEFTVAAVVPISELQIGRAKSGADAGGKSNKTQTVSHPIVLDGTPATHQGARLAVRPMGIGSLDTGTRLTVVPDGDDVIDVDPAGWQAQPVQMQTPAALWGDPVAAGATPEPAAKTVADCLTGLQGFRPPVGQTSGTVVGPISPGDLGLYDLDHKQPRQSPLTLPQPAPAAAGRKGVDFAATAGKRARIAEALFNAGFAEAAGFKTGQSAPRPLSAAPLHAHIATGE